MCTDRKLVDRANDWLQTNIGVCEVKTCETVTWWTEQMTGYRRTLESVK